MGSRLIVYHEGSGSYFQMSVLGMIWYLLTAGMAPDRCRGYRPNLAALTVPG